MAFALTPQMHECSNIEPHHFHERVELLMYEVVFACSSVTMKRTVDARVFSRALSVVSIVGFGFRSLALYPYDQVGWPEHGWSTCPSYSPTGYPAPVNTRSFWGDPAPVKRTLWPGPRPGPKKELKA